MADMGPDDTGNGRDQEWLRRYFEFEVCTECGWDADKHTVGPDPLGMRHAYCTDPLPDAMPDDQVELEFRRRTAISSDGFRAEEAVGLFLATLDTRHYRFVAGGHTEEAAREALRRSWERHAAETGAALLWGEMSCDVEVVCLVAGAALRDGEAF